MEEQEVNRKALQSRFWAWIEPSMEAYGDQLDAALDAMPDALLKQFVSERADTQEEEE